VFYALSEQRAIGAFFFSDRTVASVVYLGTRTSEEVFKPILKDESPDDILFQKSWSAFTFPQVNDEFH
jgi:hypothetical protein